MMKIFHLLAILGTIVGVFSLDSTTILGRSTLYQGLQTKSANPVYFGIAWNDHNDERGTFYFRERSLQSDLETTIQFKRCDGVYFCHTEVLDTLHTELHLRFRWVKPTDRNDSFTLVLDGWVTGEVYDLFGESTISIYSYIGISNPDAQVVMSSPTVIDGVDPDFGDFRLTVTPNQTKTSRNSDNMFYLVNRTNTPFYMTSSIYPEPMIHGVVEEDSPACCYPFNHRRVLPNQIWSKEPNIIIFQNLLTTPFSIRFDFENPKSPPKPFDFENVFSTYQTDFETKFEDTYPIFNFLENVSSSTEITKDEWKEFSLTTFSSLLNGLSYYEGVSYYEDEFGTVHKSPTDHKLLSMVPSKKGFPHPFYWDESFHEMLSLRMYPELHETVTNYWYLNVQNFSTGWIAREQVIGSEALELCPQWAWADSVLTMNPPSYFLANEMYNNIYPESVTKKYISSIYNHLKSTAEWYLQNTESRYVPYTYKWNGRQGDGSYDSGLDDFPRTNPPSEYEANVDIQSWVLKTMNVMKQMATLLDLTEDISYFSALESLILKNLQKYFWSEEEGFYFDIVFQQEQDKALEYVEHVGVVGLLPMCLGIETNLTRVEMILSKVEDELFDKNGIMSLSKKDDWFFVGDGDYWRGNIWINMQYLCYRAMKNYEDEIRIKNDDDRYLLLGDRMKQLRKHFQLNLAEMMYDNWNGRSNGGIYETYHPGSGKGYNHLPFTGWSTLIVLIMAEDYR